MSPSTEIMQSHDVAAAGIRDDTINAASAPSKIPAVEYGQSEKSVPSKKVTDALNECLCGKVLGPTDDRVIQCKAKGCETQWVRPISRAKKSFMVLYDNNTSIVSSRLYRSGSNPVELGLRDVRGVRWGARRQAHAPMMSYYHIRTCLDYVS